MFGRICVALEPCNAVGRRSAERHLVEARAEQAEDLLRIVMQLGRPWAQVWGAGELFSIHYKDAADTLRQREPLDI